MLDRTARNCTYSSPSDRRVIRYPIPACQRPSSRLPLRRDPHRHTTLSSDDDLHDCWTTTITTQSREDSLRRVKAPRGPLYALLGTPPHQLRCQRFSGTIPAIDPVIPLVSKRHRTQGSFTRCLPDEEFSEPGWGATSLGRIHGRGVERSFAFAPGSSGGAARRWNQVPAPNLAPTRLRAQLIPPLSRRPGHDAWNCINHRRADRHHARIWRDNLMEGPSAAP